MKHLIVAITLVLTLTGCDLLSGAPDPGPTKDVGPVVAEVPATLAGLTVAPEGRRDGYDRDLFTHWIDADGNGCETRAEVLLAESLTPAVIGGGCYVESGTWTSSYDGYSTTDPHELEIDHVVALAEAYDSGARNWSPQRRQDFANDMTDPQTLIAVTSASNQEKSDNDPAEWQPSNQGSWCSYATAWVNVKVRWDLTADRAEVKALTAMLASCDATAATTQPSVPPATVPLPAPAPTDELYPTCAAARAAGAAPVYEGQPGYRVGLDGDRDGVACEG